MPIYKSGGKKDGLQRYRVRVAVTNAEGHTRQIERVAYGLEAAKLTEIELLQERKSPTARAITLNALADEWEKSRLKSVRETSRAKDRQYLKHHILPYLGEQRIDHLGTKALQEWKNQLDNTTLALRTKNLAYSTLNAALNYAVRMEYLPTNPLTKLGRFRDALAEPHHEMQYYTPEEFRLFIAAAKAAAPPQAQKISP